MLVCEFVDIETGSGRSPSPYIKRQEGFFFYNNKWKKFWEFEKEGQENLKLTWHTRVDWKFNRQIKILSWNMTKRGLFSNIVRLPCGVHIFFIDVEVLGFYWFSRFHEIDQQPQIWRHCHCDKCFSCSWTDYSQQGPNPETRDCYRPVQRHSYTQQPVKPMTCMLQHCTNETRQLSSVLLGVWSW